MDRPGKNDGIIVHGSGTITAGALAVGHRAQAINRAVHDDLAGPELSDIAQRVTELIEQLRLHADELPNTSDLLDATETIVQELAKDDPNPMTITAILGALATGVHGVDAAVAAVEALTAAFNAAC